MENNFNNTPENPEGNVQPSNTEANQGGDTVYTDPNSTAYNYQQAESYNNTNYQQQYQDNYNYNVGNNTGYTQEYSAQEDNQPISLGEWILILLLMSIPCVNLILCCVWGFGKQGNITKRNFCRAQLIFVAIGLVLSIVMVFILIAVVGIGAGAAGSYYYY